MVVKNICQVISFSEAKNILAKLQFFGNESIADDFINEIHILSIAKRLGKEVQFLPISNWDEFEAGRIDILPEQLVDVCFRGLEYHDEKLIIITMESYTSKKVFLVDFVHYVEFANTYDSYLCENIDFVQPADYIFLLLNQKIVVYIHHDGMFAHIKF